MVACSGAGAAPAQSPEGDSTSAKESKAIDSAAVFVGCGFVYAGNAGNVPFSAFLKGNEASPVSDHAFVLDNVLFEVQLVPAEQIGDPALRGKDLLMKHLRWELDYTSKTNKWPPIEPKGVKDLEIPNLAAVGWLYETPEPINVAGQEVDHMFYATAAIGNVVFVVASPLRPGEDVGNVAARLWDIMYSIKTLDQAVDPLALSKKLKNGEHWPGCNGTGK
jgi:hypothetical protein